MGLLRWWRLGLLRTSLGLLLGLLRWWHGFPGQWQNSLRRWQGSLGLSSLGFLRWWRLGLLRWRLGLLKDALLLQQWRLGLLQWWPNSLRLLPR